MKKLISDLKKKYVASSDYYEKALIYSYIEKNDIKYNNTGIIYDFLADGKEQYIPIAKYITDNNAINSIDDLIVAFEMLVIEKEKKIKGVVYTPPVIRDFICNNVITTQYIPQIIDPACGCGAFLISAARKLREKYSISYKEIFDTYIYGCDIDEHSILKAKLLFDILALQEEGIEIFEFPHLFKANSLSKFATKKYKKKFDVVVGNPPYVRAKNIEETVKDSLKHWSVVSGNVDLYIPFYQLGIELLKPNGLLGYISPNTFLQSVNGRGLRNYIRDRNVLVKIINFKEEQNFSGVTHYTCIAFVCNNHCESVVQYAVNDNSNIYNSAFTQYDISKYTDNQEWRFSNRQVDDLIFKIEHQQQKLDDYGIKNGLATLCNDLFFFTVESEDDFYYYRTYENQPFKIEKNICIDVAKPNIMRNEKDLQNKIEKAIYPYKNGQIIDEPTMKNRYPYAYYFLLQNKKRLLDRDKGKTDDYPQWYAYGRTQGMNNKGLKLLLPYMADRGVAIISPNTELLFYCGYAVFADDMDTLKLLKVFIESDVFLFYIKMTSKPYSKGFMALAKNYIKNFGIPNLSENQKRTLLTLDDMDRERYICSLYGINYEDMYLLLEKAS